jgi:predicted RNA polymerase sigma factor
VLHVLYLIFNEGYASSTGPALHRAELSNEAIQLTRMVQRMLPEDGEVTGLLALMLHHRCPPPRAYQRRRGTDLVGGTGSDTLGSSAHRRRGLLDQPRHCRGGGGAYQVQAAIAALHDQAPHADDTDWPQILALYGLLEQITGNPVVTLNRAVAAAMAHGPSAGLALLDEVDERLTGHHRLDAVRAHLLEMAGDTEAAYAYYGAAASRTTSLPEQRYPATRAVRHLPWS